MTSAVRAASLLSVLLFACGDDGRRVARDASAGDAGAPDLSSPRDFGPRRDLGEDLDDVIVWAHSPRELFAFDPRENTVTLVGTFLLPGGEGAEDMTDLAVDRDGNLVTCSFDNLFAVDPETAQVTLIGPLDVSSDVRFNALTFVPPGVLDPSAEVLIAATAEGNTYRIDRSTGATIPIGSFADGYGSSGDIVSVEGAGTFATAFRDDLDSDWLVRLDPMTGAITPIGPTGSSRLFGLAYWRNQLYAFDSFGRLLAIDIDTGEATLTESDTGADLFFGAGVTTVAPTTPLI